ncbi:MAG TPA: hypothetical protein VG028_15895 [Terriglobia bacterium]|nr:hypothetical protein [Terriglobia bacterium]
MKIPGFAAQESLFKTGKEYRVAGASGESGGAVRTAVVLPGNKIPIDVFA